MDHALVAVGYGTTPEGRQYWILKNSWGAAWGDAGFMYVPRNTGGKGACGLAGAPGYAVRAPRGWEDPEDWVGVSSARGRMGLASAPPC